MADFSFGSTFQPGAQQQQQPWMRGQQGGGPSPYQATSPVQQAIQVLSLRLPQVFGPSAPIAQSLASTGQYGGAGPTHPSAVAQSVVSNVLGRPQPQIPAAPPVTQQPGGMGAPRPATPAPATPTAPPVYRGYQAPSMPSVPNMPNLPSEAAQLGNVIQNLPPSSSWAPAISMGLGNIGNRLGFPIRMR